MIKGIVPQIGTSLFHLRWAKHAFWLLLMAVERISTLLTRVGVCHRMFLLRNVFVMDVYTLINYYTNCTATDQSAVDYTLLHSNECKKCNQRLIGRNGGVVVMDDYKRKQNSERC